MKVQIKDTEFAHQKTQSKTTFEFLIMYFHHGMQLINNTASRLCSLKAIIWPILASGVFTLTFPGFYLMFLEQTICLTNMYLQVR